MPYTAILTGLVLGAFLGWCIARIRSSAQGALLAATRQQLTGAHIQLAEMQRQLETRSAQLSKTQIESSASIAAAQARLESFERELANGKQTEQRLKESFAMVAAEALKGNNQQFIALAKSELERQHQHAEGDLEARKKEVENLVKPISDTLDKLGKEVRDIETKREGAYSEIRTQVESLRLTGDQIKSETARLVGALKMPQQRGRWGEIQLRRVVELAGMVRYCDFDEQVGVRDAEDNLLKPDMTVKLPGGRTIVVDSKVSLSAYLEAAACEDDDAFRTVKLKEHAAQIRAHLSKLSAKTYWNQFEKTPEFVVAFLPGEALFSAALQQDPALIEFGAEQRVVLATPTTLIALLKAVSYGWRQEDIARNAQQISELGKQLYERLSTMYGHFTDLGGSLDRSVRQYNKVVGALESRVMVSARKFRELGATAAEEITVADPIEDTPRELNALSSANIRSIAASASLGEN